jgi:putative ABC transport system permease protein
VLVGVVALSLVVGGIVIMNIMLMAGQRAHARDRLRKALGARRAEHHVAGAHRIGGRCRSSAASSASLLGFLAAVGIAAVTPLRRDSSSGRLALGIGITAGVGLFFGMYRRRAPRRSDPDRGPAP